MDYDHGCQEATPGCRWDRTRGRQRQPCWERGGTPSGGSGAGGGPGSGGRTEEGKGKDEEDPGGRRRLHLGGEQRGRVGIPRAVGCLDHRRKEFGFLSVAVQHHHLCPPS